MPLQTTVIGSYPKPEYVNFLPSWFNKITSEHFSFEEYNKAIEDHKDDLATLLERAAREVLQEQIDVGIDVVTDGELIRENYIFHFCRQIEGIDCINTKIVSKRNGACAINCPVINSKLNLKDGPSLSSEEWKTAQSMSTKPVKFTLPGPMTILGTSHLDESAPYQSEKEASVDLVHSINKEVLALAAAGCKYIQIDEPLLVRSPEIALDYGIEHLSQCFEGVGPDVTKVIHLCCGYPNHLDQEDYAKSDPSIYHQIAERIDNIGVDEISIEDAHRHNDPTLFTKFKKSKVIVGVLKIACSKIETVEEICDRVKDILKFIPKDRLILAPDCGLAYLYNREVRLGKLKNMVAAAKLL